MKIKLQSIIALFILVATSTFGQTHQAWVSSLEGGANLSDDAYSVAVDTAGNVYVGGYVSTAEGSDGVTVKYNAAGELQWIRTYAGPMGSCIIIAIAVDDSSNVYVTGQSAETTLATAAVTIKYNSDGIQQWISKHTGTSANYTNAGLYIATDHSGNVYVSGFAVNSSSNDDFCTIKYNASGIEQWVEIYNGPGNDEDMTLSMILDDSANVYITGRSKDGGDDFATLKYNTDGVQQWVARYNNPLYPYWGETPRSLAVDHAGNVIVTGWGVNGIDMGDFLTIKYNSVGAEQWIKRYHGFGGGEGGNSVGLDDSGNIYVAGSTDNDYVTIKYSPSGDELWVNRYDGPAYDWDWAAAMKVDAAGNSYVTGFSTGINSGFDYVTIKYDSSGTQQWLETYNGLQSNNDRARAIAIDASGNAYVTGFAIQDAALTSDIVTIKYSSVITGIQTDQKGINEGFSIYPNPAKDKITISHNSNLADEITISVFSINGMLLLQNKFSNQVMIEMDVKTLTGGIYLLQIQSRQGIETKKMLIK